MDIATTDTTAKTLIPNAVIHRVGGMDYVFKTANLLKDGAMNITNGELAVDTTVKMVVGECHQHLFFYDFKHFIPHGWSFEERSVSK